MTERIPNPDHPKAVAARQAAAAKRAERERWQGIIDEAKANYGVKFLSVNNTTVCYRVIKRNVIEVSNTLKHPNDANDKLTAQIIAFGRFSKHQCVVLRRPNYFKSPEAFLKAVFQ